jgi:hypothetical protein
MSQNIIFTYERARYLKWASFLIIAGIVAYVFDEPAIKPSGGTWLGYTLGTIGALLIVWLMFFGMRKRAYSSTLGTVKGWLSAHVYLGLALITIATLHTGFEFGWNVHTLAYSLMMIVIGSGIWGVVIYSINPALMGSALRGKTLEEMAKQLRDIDKQARNIASNLDAEAQALVEKAANGVVFANNWQKFTGRNPNCSTQVAVDALGKRNFSAGGTGSVEHDLYTLELKRLEQLKRIREYVRLKHWVEGWLFFHVPLSFALLAALTAHIVSVFFYW